MDTSEYAAGLARADRKTFERFYDEYSPRLYHYILGRLRNRSDSEDVLQTVMVRLVRNRKRLGRVENLTAYVFTIARNESNRFAKSAAKRKESTDLQLVEPRDEKREPLRNPGDVRAL
ncbi:MAG: sigma factor [Planctomycetota bacterium]|nr:sigma factor [Planctomycetota bacterium]